MRPLIHNLTRDSRGAAMVEFALVAPVLMLTLIGLFDLSMNMYTASMVEGAIQQAARESTIEGATTSEAAIDTNVRNIVQDIVPNATLTFTRTAYTSFSNARRPEDFTDTDLDGVCNNGEPFEDSNGNNAWDLDPGRAGMGGARDAVLYTVTATYDRQLPLYNFIGVPDTVTTVARTILRNQPFGMQENTITVGACT